MFGWLRGIMGKKSKQTHENKRELEEARRRKERLEVRLQTMERR